jgi:RNA-directed DNA polymerase
VSKRWIIEGDIKGCFDNIRHSHIIETLTSWKVSDWIVNLIGRMLASGGEVGTPQGGIISPMLANVALTCLDTKLANYGKKTSSHNTNPIVRYADDFIIIADNKRDAQALKETVKHYLEDRVGLELSEEKTHITEINKGFDFLGFNIRKHKEKLLIKPSKDNIKEFRQKIKEVVKSSLNFTGEHLIRKLNPIITGWGNYYRHVVSKIIYNKQDRYIFYQVLNWAKNKHAKRPTKWIIRRYFKSKRSDKWVLKDEGKSLNFMSKIPIKRFIKVRKDVRVYDMEDTEYWNKREFLKAWSSLYSKGLNILFKEQEGKCDYCKRDITKQDVQSYNTHKHHLKPRTAGGADDLHNLRLLHRECHQEIHSKLSRKKMASYISKGIDYVSLMRPA